jgi:hypothetical protein
MRAKFEKTKVKFPKEKEIVIFYLPTPQKTPLYLIPKNQEQLEALCSFIEEKLFREECQKAIKNHFGKQNQKVSITA